MKKTLVSLFALLAMGSTAFAAENVPFESKATITTKVIAPLSVVAPATVTLDDVIRTEKRAVDEEFTFKLTGEPGEEFSYALENTTPATETDNPKLEIRNPEATGFLTVEADGGNDITFKVIEIDATTVTATGTKTFEYTLTVEYTKY